jgi:cytochrome bd-type quinol oxidase subunit 2
MFCWAEQILEQYVELFTGKKQEIEHRFIYKSIAPVWEANQCG